MELNQGEFDSVTQRLEQYASQVSILQTRLEIQPELVRKDEELARLRTELKDSEMRCMRAEEELEELKGKYELLAHQTDSALVENAWLKNCILLSLTSIRTFMRMVKRVELKSLFITFLHKTILPDMGVRGIHAIDDTMDLTDINEIEKLADQIILENHGNVTHGKVIE